MPRSSVDQGQRFSMAPVYGGQRRPLLGIPRMNLEVLLPFIERLLTRRTPKTIAGRFFTLSATTVFFGSWRGFSPPTLFLAVSTIAVVALMTLGLRWIERRCP